MGTPKTTLQPLKTNIFPNKQTLFNLSAIAHVYQGQRLNPQWHLIFLMTENGPSSSDLKNFPNNEKMTYCRGRTEVEQLRNDCQWLYLCSLGQSDTRAQLSG